MRRVSMTLCAALLVAACAKNPVTGKRQLALISENQEIQMGQQYAKEVEGSIGLYPDQKVQDYVSRLGKELVVGSERPEVPYQFHVLDDPTVNAFALPGGPVFITRGIMTYMNDEAELAGVVGHEIGHVSARHSVEQLSKAQAMQLGLGLGQVFIPSLRGGLGQLAGAGLQLMMLGNSRDAEREADVLGFKYSVNHNYDARAMSTMFETLTRVSSSTEGGKLPEWLSTHPNPENRVGTNNERVAKAGKDFSHMKRNREEFLKLIDGMVFGENPRQGFFRGNVFLHPDLKLQLSFPGGWKTQNTPQVVGAVSPQQDAVVAMAPAEGAPQTELQKFLSQQGIQAGQVSQAPVNGNPAASATFQAQTEQGVIEGMTTFLSYGGHTFQLLGYTKQGGLATYGPLFQATINSFNALTDPAALNVQPARVQLVKVPRDMTVADFTREFPSTVPAKQIAIINGLDENGTLKAGQTAKRVVGGVPQS